jgi:hypothetical protein
VAKKKLLRENKRQVRPSRGKMLDAGIVQTDLRRPIDCAASNTQLQRGSVPRGRKTETQVFSDKVFAPLEGEDLQCKVLDDEGNSIPFTIEQRLWVIK